MFSRARIIQGEKSTMFCHQAWQEQTDTWHNIRLLTQFFFEEGVCSFDTPRGKACKAFNSKGRYF